MPSMPDPSYWGNPPQTPTAASRAQRQAMPQQAWQPQSVGRQPAGPEQASQPYAAPPTGPNTQQGHTDQPRTQPQATPYAQPQAAPQPQQQPGVAPVQAAPPQQPDGTPQQHPNATSGQPNKRHKSRRHSVVIVAIAAVATLAVIICVVLLVRGAIQAGIEQIAGSTANAPSGIVDDGGSFDSATEPDIAMMNSTVRSYYGLSGSDPLTRDELDAIQHDHFDDADHSGQAMPSGVYIVGETINAGTYWFEGEDAELSSFYLLQPTDDGKGYNVALLNDYYGHNLMELKNGEVLILDNDEGMRHIDPIAPLDNGFKAPYSSGVYRVGVDVPAGSYRLGIGSGADDFSAIYIMSDLEYTDGSYLYEAQYVEGDRPDEVTLEEGTYVELYNMTMSPIKA